MAAWETEKIVTGTDWLLLLFLHHSLICILAVLVFSAILCQGILGGHNYTSCPWHFTRVGTDSMAETTSLQQPVDMVSLALAIHIDSFSFIITINLTQMVRENVTLAAHKNQKKYSMLDDLDYEKSIQDTWKNNFVANWLGTEHDLKDRMIAMQFIIQQDLLFTSTVI